ncbi:hypothetical protein [Chryseobacterium sp. JK1]|uniref:hypothetical protein n=1 Tax=Chryseobacterium sp. JK1 TaxID=874294 RepID=UPI003D68110B
MKEKYLFFLLVMSISLTAQTKLIAFKSHSGSTENFGRAVANDLFDANFSNLGLPPKKYIIESKLDSVIIFDDEKSVLVTSEKSFKDPEGKWMSERIPVGSRSFFSKKNIDSAKKKLKKDYDFVNNMDSVVFIKYDKESKSYKEIKPVKVEEKKEKREKGTGSILLGILLISGASGFYGWKRVKRNNE